jgi:hypothetical protein
MEGFKSAHGFNGLFGLDWATVLGSVAVELCFSRVWSASKSDGDGGNGHGWDDDDYFTTLLR